MSDICPVCGMPKELCVCGEISKEQQRINIQVTRRTFGKAVTIISGFDKSVDVERIAKELRKKLACGGTVKNNTIELQGDHRERVKELLIKMGFKEEMLNA